MPSLQTPPPVASAAPVPSPAPLAEIAGDPAHAPVNGHVTLKCRITSSAGVDHCAVAEETPGGHGLGALALRAAAKFKLRSETAGAVRPRGVITLPMTFKTDGTPPPPS